MALPKIDKPLFSMLVPSQKREVKFRPFVVKEEKILLIAQQSGQEKDMVRAIKQILTNCVADEKFDVETLTTFDLEYMFLKLRAKSVNNVIEVSYRDVEDDKVYEFNIDLDEVEMLEQGKVDNNIKITDNVGVVMKYPSISVVENVPDDLPAAELVEYLVRSCIDVIYDEDTVYPAKDCTDDELTDFIESLDIETFIKIREFFDNLPRMYYKIEYKNSLGNDRTIELTTLSDFFTWG